MTSQTIGQARFVLADLGDVEMAVDGSPAPDLEVTHPQFVLGLLEAVFDRPPGEGDPQEPFDRDAFVSNRHVGDEVLDLVRQDVACDDDRARPSRQAVLMLPPEQSVLDLPDDWSLLAVLDVEPPPFLSLEDSGVPQQVPNFAEA